jgi:excisionase family DNA binding protein
MDYLTTRDAARHLGVTTQRVGMFIRQGRLSATRIGRDWMILSSDLDTFASKPRTNGHPKVQNGNPELSTQ